MKNIAIIGCGYWGKNLARNLNELGALARVVDPSPAAQALAKDFGVAWSPSIPDSLQDATIKAVVIATPAVTHAKIALEAMQAGKDVFIEKPLALATADAAEVSATADAQGRILMVGHLLQYHPVYLRLKALVQAGTLGKIRHIISTRCNFGLIRTEENVLWSFAPHDISMVLGLAGGAPHRLSAVGSAILQKGIPDITTLHLQFEDGVTADISSSWLNPQKEQKLTVIGEAGMAVFSDTSPWAEKLKLFKNEVSWTDGKPKAQPGAAAFEEVAQAEPLREEMRHFIACVETRQRPRTDGKEAIAVLSVLQAAQTSLDAGGTWVNVEAAMAAPTSSNKKISIHPSAVVDEGVSIGEGTRIWHFSHVLGGSQLGRNCVVGQNVMIGPDVTIGDGCKLQNNVALYKGVHLANNVFCGPSMVFTNVLTPRAHVERKNEFLATHVGEGATLGANCTIVCGHDIGAYAMVGAGAVVTKTVPPHALVVGNPARQIGWVSRDGERLGKDMICPRSGEDYSYLLDGKGR